MRNQSSNQLVVLAPSRRSVSGRFRCTDVDHRRHTRLLGEMQRFRGRIYAADGAVRLDSLTRDGRHNVPVDARSWHVLSLDERGRICACLRYLDESWALDFDQLWVRHAAQASPLLGFNLRQAVEQQMDEARRIGLCFGEVGGWAVEVDRRNTIEALRIILVTYGLLQALGGCTGVATATFRHSSAPILRRIGLESITADGTELQPYYDPRYGCQMEVLRFDSRYPNPKYREWVAEFATLLTTVPVICAAPAEFEVRLPDPALLPDLVPALAVA
jgi:hypothetical protein